MTDLAIMLVLTFSLLIGMFILLTKLSNKETKGEVKN